MSDREKKTILLASASSWCAASVGRLELSRATGEEQAFECSNGERQTAQSWDSRSGIGQKIRSLQSLEELRYGAIY